MADSTASLLMATANLSSELFGSHLSHNNSLMSGLQMSM